EQVKSQVVGATMAVLTALTGGLHGRAAPAVVPDGTSPGTSSSAGQTAQAPIVAYERCAENSAGGRRGAGLVNPPSAGGPGTVTEAVSIVSNAFPERQILNDAVDLTNADPILAAGGSLVRGDPAAAVQIANSTVNYTGANALVEVDRAGTTANLAGSLVSIVDSTINSTGALFTLSNGAQLTSGPATRTEGGLVETKINSIAGALLSESVLNGASLVGAGEQPTVEVDRSTVTAASGIASILNGARLVLDGPFIAII